MRRASPFLLSAARQRAFGLPLPRSSAGRASVRRRSFRPFRGGDLLRALPRLHQQGRIVVPALQAVRHPLLWNGENGFPLLSRCTVPERRSRRWGMLPADRSMGREKGLSAQRAGARRRVPRQDDGRGLVSFLFRRWLVASARHPGVVACAAGGRGRGLRSPLPPTTPYPALGQPFLTVLRNQSAVPLPPFCRAAAGVRTPSVPRKRGTSVRPASELPPLPGRGSPPRPAALTSTRQNRCSRFASGTSSLAVERGKRLSFVESVHCAGESLPTGEG